MGDEPGWPVLRPIGRGWTWTIRMCMAGCAAICVLHLVDVVIDPSPRPAWRWALIGVGALVALTASARAWVVAGRVRRILPDPLRPRASFREYREARVALREGAVLTDRRRRLVAVESPPGPGGACRGRGAVRRRTVSRPRGARPALALATLSLAIGVVFLVLGNDTGAAVATIVTCGLTMTVSTRRLLARRRRR